MKLFEFFRNKRDNPSNDDKSSHNVPRSDFDFLLKYAEYLIIHMNNHSEGNYSPIAAYENDQNELVGYIYLNSDNSYNISAEEAIENMRLEFNGRLHSNKIKSYAIFYHIQTHRTGVDPEKDGLNCIYIEYQRENDEKGIFKMPYSWNGAEFMYQNIVGFTSDQTEKLITTPLMKRTLPEYFQERIIITPEVSTNELGIKIKQVNNGDFENTWGATIGFKLLRDQGENLKMKYYSTCISTEPIKNNGLYIEHNLVVDKIKFKAIEMSGTKLFFPTLLKKSALQFEVKEIHEWHNYNKLVSVITGRGKDTFGLIFLCIDYYENHETYKKYTNHKVNIFGLGYALDVYKPDENDAQKFSKDFCAYMLNENLSEFGCFDFIGMVISVEECAIPNGKIIKVKLINHPEVENLFDLDIFFNEENMRVKELKEGMHITGLFQLLGELEK